MDIEYDTYDPEPARRAALAALARWPARRDRLPEERADLVATAWHTGVRTITQLAATADVDRSTIYADLAARAIDPKNRDAPYTKPLGRGPLPAPIARDLSQRVADTVRPYKHTQGGDTPLTTATSILGHALGLIADAIDTDPTTEQGTEVALELISCLGSTIRYAHRHLAADQSPDEVARRTYRAPS